LDWCFSFNVLLIIQYIPKTKCSLKMRKTTEYKKLDQFHVLIDILCKSIYKKDIEML
jgi:hypothetical protein